MIYLTIAILAFTTFIGIIIKNYGIQKSVSFSDVVAQKPYKWFFEATMFICGEMVGIYAYINSYTTLLIAGIMIFIIGLFPLGDRPKWIYYPHMFFAIGGFALLILHFGLDLQQWYISIIITALSGVVTLLSKNKIWSFELSVIYLAFIFLLWV
jgi:lysylphosphatidylglycerol synthetase-like protein (DUF2156 family)